MNYRSFIGREVVVVFKDSKFLNYSKWRAYGYPTMCINGTVTNGTCGVLVIEEKETNLTYRINDELIVFFKEV